MLYGRAVQAFADCREQFLSLWALDAVELDLDEPMGFQGTVDLLQYGVGEPVLADADDGMEGMGGGAQASPLDWCQFDHGGIVPLSWTTKQKKKSKAWMQEHVNDPYVQRAKKEGWRSRAVFKLSEIDERDKLLRPGMVVVDLGAAPGSWCQYTVKRIKPGGRLIALDLLPMEPMPGVEFLQGDFREEEMLQRLDETLGGRQVDLVLSDMAPNMSGVAVADNARVMYLAELTLDFCREHLKPGGDMLVKVFQGAGFMELRQGVVEMFEALNVRKPAASRDRSAETYLLARRKRLQPT